MPAATGSSLLTAGALRIDGFHNGFIKKNDAFSMATASGCVLLAAGALIRSDGFLNDLD